MLDELHTYRGRQGSDVAMLVRRVRDRLEADQLQCIGTSATLATEGSFDEQRARIADVATNLFGSEVLPQNVLGETLRRATPDRNITDTQFLDELRRRLAESEGPSPTDYASFIADPLSVWIESTFGLRSEDGTGRLVRARPRGIAGKDGASAELSSLTGANEGQCAEAIQKALMAGYACPNPDTGFPGFAFRIHQFVSRGDTVYATVEPEGSRHVTLQGQQFVPGDRSRLLLPLVFCRECGQEYYSVRMTIDDEADVRVFTPRGATDLQAEGDEEPGFLHVSAGRALAHRSRSRAGQAAG